jgi:hypothetical protein
MGKCLNPFTMKICEVIWIFTKYLWKTGSWKGMFLYLLRLNVHQFGFRPGHSTISAATLVLDVLNCLNNQNHCAALFVDLSKPFDTVDHYILIQRLTEVGLDQAFLHVVWLSVRSDTVISDGVKSSVKSIPQGSWPMFTPMLPTVVWSWLDVLWVVDHSYFLLLYPIGS